MTIQTCQDILIRRSIRFRNLRLSVGRNGRPILSIPLFCPEFLARRFLAANRDWIATHRTPPPKRFSDGQRLTILGQEVQICHAPNQAGTVLRDDRLLVGGEDLFLNRRVTDYIKRRTQEYIAARAPALAQKIGRTVRRITLKDTTSRWGSCSTRGNLNFCWRLGMAPLFVLDYIIAHEVAHLSEMNHSPRFWQVVSNLCDRRADAEIWLRRHGADLR